MNCAWLSYGYFRSWYRILVTYMAILMVEKGCDLLGSDCEGWNCSRHGRRSSEVIGVGVGWWNLWDKMKMEKRDVLGGMVFRQKARRSIQFLELRAIRVIHPRQPITEMNRAIWGICGDSLQLQHDSLQWQTSLCEFIYPVKLKKIHSGRPGTFD